MVMAPSEVRCPSPRTLALLLAAAGLAAPRAAEACGCFAPATPAEPVIQAGERIAFAQRDGRVTAHIQIQYQGSAEEFAWLVPLPSEPTLRLGTEALFTALQVDTVPQFLLQNVGRCGGGPTFACGSDDSAAIADRPSPRLEEAVLDIELSTAGPFAYGIVPADAKQPLLTWLNENRFFVPTDVEDVLDPYIRSGSYFLALKLRAGEPVGAIQPVVLEYASELPMIPIILTSASATRDMPVLVWVFGEHRAVPHNYAQVELNEAYIDWFGGAQNYASVVARAVDEAEGGHAFVTEFSDRTIGMSGRDIWSRIFLARSTLETATSTVELRNMTLEAGWPMEAVDSVLAQHSSFDSAALVEDLWERVATPAFDAQMLFRSHPTVTRFHTALDPEEMTRDPVFAFNPDLPPVDRLHRASFDGCGTSGQLSFADGREVHVDDRFEWSPALTAQGDPRAARISLLRMEGSPMVVVDNSGRLSSSSGGCRTFGRDWGGAFQLAVLFAFVLIGRWPLRRSLERSQRASSGDRP